MLNSMRRTVQHWLRGKGIEIRKAPGVNYRNLDVFRLGIEVLMARRGTAITFVQVGANDGKFVDPLRPYIDAYPWRGILVEPQPDIFELLKQNYSSASERLAFENVAIARSNTLTLYRAAGDGPNKQADRAVVSANPSVTKRQLIDNAALEPFDVPALTLDALLETHGFESIDLLQIDTEGFDWEVLKTLSLERFRPALIQLETGHLPRQVIGELVDHLNAHDYDVYYGGYQGDTVAMQRELLAI
jgi:FkbM family methyltransferase